MSLSSKKEDGSVEEEAESSTGGETRESAIEPAENDAKEPALEPAEPAEPAANSAQLDEIADSGRVEESGECSEGDDILFVSKFDNLPPTFVRPVGPFTTIEQQASGAQSNKTAALLSAYHIGASDGLLIWSWNIHGKSDAGYAALRHEFFSDICAIHAPSIICIQEPKLAQEGFMQAYPLNFANYGYFGNAEGGIYFNQDDVTLIRTLSIDRGVMCRFCRTVAAVGNTKHLKGPPPPPVRYYFEVVSYHAEKKSLDEYTINLRNIEFLAGLSHHYPKEFIVVCADLNVEFCDIDVDRIPEPWALAVYESNRKKIIDHVLYKRSIDNITIGNVTEEPIYNEPNGNGNGFNYEYVDIATFDRMVARAAFPPHLQPYEYHRITGNHRPISFVLTFTK